MYVPPIRFMMRKNVPASRRAGRTDGSIRASVKFSVVFFCLTSFSGLYSRTFRENLRTWQDARLMIARVNFATDVGITRLGWTGPAVEWHVCVTAKTQPAH